MIEIQVNCCSTGEVGLCRKNTALQEVLQVFFQLGEDIA